MNVLRSSFILCLFIFDEQRIKLKPAFLPGTLVHFYPIKRSLNYHTNLHRLTSFIYIKMFSRTMKTRYEFFKRNSSSLVLRQEKTLTKVARKLFHLIFKCLMKGHLQLRYLINKINF